MFKFDRKKMITAIIPFFILIISWILAMESIESLNKLNAVFMTLPYFLAVFALLLSVWFQHSRVFFAVYILFFTMCVVPSLTRLNHRALTNGISLVVPVAFILLAVMKERGITSKYGLMKGLFFSALIFFVLLDAGRKSPWLGKMKTANLIFKTSEELESIPRWGVFLFICCLCILLTRLFIIGSDMDIAFVGASLGSFIILHFAGYQDVLSIFYSAVFLIFIIALFQTSYSLAFHDTLTGVLSRQALEREILQLGNKYAVAMVDIDHFKRVNDKYGHNVGDDVLKMVASMIKKNVVGGKIFRYGGEEFVIIFSRKSVEDVLDVMEQLRIMIGKRPFVIRSPNRPGKKPRNRDHLEASTDKIRVTVSIGIAEKSEKLHTGHAVIEAADKALYRAKRNGRNCVVC